MPLHEPILDVLALVRAGMIRPVSARTLSTLVPRIAREGLRPHLTYAVNALEHAHRAAIVHEDRVVTWSELNDRINRLANHLTARGVGTGGSVAITLSNRPEFIEAHVAANAVGAAVAFVDPRAPVEAARALVRRIDPAVLVTDRDDIDAREVLQVGTEYEAALRAASSEPVVVRRDADPTVVVFTSGTSGRPKGAVRSFGDASATTLGGLLRVVPLRRSDVHLVAAPLHHAAGSGFAQIAHVLGNTVVLLGKFSAGKFCRAVERHRVTTTAVVPTMLHEIAVAAPHFDLSSLRVVVCTGSKLHEEERVRARSVLGDVVYDLYGSTEMAWVSVASPDDQRRAPGTVGKPVPGVRVRILDAQGRDVARGVTGDIWASNGLVMRRYVDDDELTSERVRDGFVSVRDVGYLDPEGYLNLVDRSDDMVISGGVNVYPAETERALMAHPAVAECAVVGIPDTKWGQRVVGAVVARGGANAPQLIAWCKQRVPAPAVPKEIRIVESLPRNSVGKIDKRAVVADWGD